MKKYDLSKIMKRAWAKYDVCEKNIYGKKLKTFSTCLKESWAEAKKERAREEATKLYELSKNKKQSLIEKLESIATREEGGNWHYRAVVSDWNNYGKNRTYFSIIETRDNSKHYKKIKYGYFDNISNEYIREEYGLDIIREFNKIA